MRFERVMGIGKMMGESMETYRIYVYVRMRGTTAAG
jgi:hypothetical protein